MKPPRWFLVWPAALLLTVAAPALRAGQAGSWLPDPWLLLLLCAVPDPHEAVGGRPVFSVVLLGALRSCVTVASPFSAWAGLGLALAVRRELHRRLVELRFWARLATGTAAALPLALLDLRSADLAGGGAGAAAVLLRAAAAGCVWAAAFHPPRWSPAEEVEPAA